MNSQLQVVEMHEGFQMISHEAVKVQMFHRMIASLVEDLADLTEEIIAHMTEATDRTETTTDNRHIRLFLLKTLQFHSISFICSY